MGGRAAGCPGALVSLFLCDRLALRGYAKLAMGVVDDCDVLPSGSGGHAGWSHPAGDLWHAFDLAGGVSGDLRAAYAGSPDHRSEEARDPAGKPARPGGHGSTGPSFALADQRPFSAAWFRARSVEIAFAPIHWVQHE